jgi:hypothetical protein
MRQCVGTGSKENVRPGRLGCPLLKQQLLGSDGHGCSEAPACAAPCAFLHYIGCGFRGSCQVDTLGLLNLLAFRSSRFAYTPFGLLQV